MLVLAAAAGCGRKQPARANVPAAPAPVAGAYVEQGVASWYGVPFNGRRAANGEVYDKNKPTAAHRTLPFGTMVRVTNLDNGRQTEVRIIDRGPFVQGRIIDLSFAAARSVDMVGAGRIALPMICFAGRRLAVLATPPHTFGAEGGTRTRALDVGNVASWPLDDFRPHKIYGASSES